MRIALFGGTFDPIHNAHLAVAREAADRFQLDRILFIPAAHPPHKQAGAHAAYEDRVRMTELAIDGEPRFCASRLEEGTVRSYSIDTIEKARATVAPEGDLFFLIGADAFAEVRTWRRWRDVAAAVHFLVVSRPNAVYEPPPDVRFDRLDTLHLAISSSEIRAELALGKRPVGLPDAVQRYIEERGLYSDSRNSEPRA